MATQDPEADELARTAAASDASASPEIRVRGPSTPALAGTLGRYRIERLLGEGGMGVVYAAFDPQLERRIALKVLRGDSNASELRQRLVREARAMARLTHTNVVAVYEVGSANERDYVAMELIQGESLAEWLRATPRHRRDIVAAFLAAGRGIAAAHAAGLVHRDFKPHNVLRAHSGRICVTDFGLARGVDVVATVSTLAARASLAGSTDHAPSSLSQLTATGSVLGTPAYMAPEQWDGATVGPAADQFAFCVALWEALTGERPFRAATTDELKQEIARGPKPDDIAKLPRSLRAILCRGAASDPAARWTNMDDLLAAIARAERRPRLAWFAVSGGVVAAAVVYALLGRGAAPAIAPADSCPAPVLDPASVWSPERAAKLANADQRDGATLIETDVRTWQRVRERACGLAPSARAAPLGCLDGVLARLDLAARTLEGVNAAPEADVGGELVDPEVCAREKPPRLVAKLTPLVVDVAIAMREAEATDVPVSEAQADAMLARVASDPCASARAQLFTFTARKTPAETARNVAAAAGAAARCGDDRLTADVALASAAVAQDSDLDNVATRAQATDMAKAVIQPDVEAFLEWLQVVLAEQNGDLDGALKHAGAARDGYVKRARWRRETSIALEYVSLLELRARPDDLAAIATQLAQLRAEAVQHFGVHDVDTRKIDFAIAHWRYANGDVVGSAESARELVGAWPPWHFDHAVQASGRVVDEHGAPVSGATVITGETLTATAAGVVYDIAQRRATTGADGSFELPDAPRDGTIIAELGNRRSAPIVVGDHVTLAVVATSRIAGIVDLRDVAPTNVEVRVLEPTYFRQEVQLTAPVRADGTFVVEGVPRGKRVVAVSVNRVYGNQWFRTSLTVGAAPVSDLHLAVATTKRTLQVAVRSTVGIDLVFAKVWVLPGKRTPKNAAEVFRDSSSIRQANARAIADDAPAGLRARANPGDVGATVHDVPEGIVAACAIGMSNQTADPEMTKKASEHLDKVPVGCTQVGPNDEVVVVEVPPWPRFD